MILWWSPFSSRHLSRLRYSKTSSYSYCFNLMRHWKRIKIILDFDSRRPHTWKGNHLFVWVNLTYNLLSFATVKIFRVWQWCAGWFWVAVLFPWERWDGCLLMHLHYMLLWTFCTVKCERFMCCLQQLMCFEKLLKKHFCLK